MLPWNDLVVDAAEHEDRGLARDERHLRGRVPLLVAQERKGSEDGEGARDQSREREERVLEHERADLSNDVSGGSWALYVRQTHGERITTGEVNGNGAADRLTVKDLEIVSFRLFKANQRTIGVLDSAGCEVT